jgi:hypothetical protein
MRYQKFSRKTRSICMSRATHGRSTRKVVRQKNSTDIKTSTVILDSLDKLGEACDRPNVISHSEYSVEIDKEETTDISNGNVAFADIEDGYNHISDDIMEAVEVDTTRFTTIAAMQTALSQGAISREDKSKIFQAQGHQFIVVGSAGSYEFREVNQLRMLQRNTDKRDADIELKIVRCPITQWEVPYVITSKYWEPATQKYLYTDSVQGYKNAAFTVQGGCGFSYHQPGPGSVCGFISGAGALYAQQEDR